VIAEVAPTAGHWWALVALVLVSFLMGGGLWWALVREQRELRRREGE
jgi:hypothetical protein